VLLMTCGREVATAPSVSAMLGELSTTSTGDNGSGDGGRLFEVYPRRSKLWVVPKRKVLPIGVQTKVRRYIDIAGVVIASGVGFVVPGQTIRNYVFFSFDIHDLEVESTEIFCPSSLSS